MITNPRNSAPREVRTAAPDAFVIDLGRLPSQGLALATWLRRQKATRAVPIVFVDGEAEKAARARSVLPDATFGEWPGIRGALSRTLRGPAADPLDPGVFAQYAGRPLATKLGIRALAHHAGRRDVVGALFCAAALVHRDAGRETERVSEAGIPLRGRSPAVAHRPR